MRAGFVVIVVMAVATRARADDALICGPARAVEHGPHVGAPLPTPLPRALDIETGPRDRVTFMYSGPRAADTALHLELSHGKDAIAVLMTPSSPDSLDDLSCEVAMPGLSEGVHLAVRLWAVDRWGATSDVAAYDAEVHRETHVRCGMPFLGVVVIVGGVFLIGLVILFIVLVVKATMRAREIAYTPAEPISLLVVEKLARSVQFRAGLGVVLCFTAAGVLVGTAPWQVFATAPLLVGLIDLHGYLTARGVLRALDRGARAEVKYCQVLVYPQGGCTRRLEVSPRRLAAARRDAVPRSTAS